MRLLSTTWVLLSLAACGSSNDSRRPTSGSGDGDGGQARGQSCETIQVKVEDLYRKSAESEGVAQNLRAEYLSANLHMVLVDCKRDPQVLSCLQRSKSVAEIEANCLVPIDDEGTAEARAFGQ